MFSRSVVIAVMPQVSCESLNRIEPGQLCCAGISGQRGGMTAQLGATRAASPGLVTLPLYWASNDATRGIRVAKPTLFRGATSMVPITYQVVGEEDYALKISVDEQGGFVVESETYTSQEPRKGVVSEVQSQELIAAIEALGLPREHPLPEGATAFEAQLTIGGPGREANYVFWEGALEADRPLNHLIRLLERL